MKNERLIELLERDNTNDNDNERKAMFTILAGNEDLYSKVDKIYDFEERSINLDVFEEVDLSRGAYQLVKLDFNLYSFHNEAIVAEVIRFLDNLNYILSIESVYVHLLLITIITLYY